MYMRRQCNTNEMANINWRRITTSKHSLNIGLQLVSLLVFEVLLLKSYTIGSVTLKNNLSVY